MNQALQGEKQLARLLTLGTLRTVPTKYQGSCTRVGPHGKSRSSHGLLGSAMKNGGSHAFFSTYQQKC